MATLEQVLGKLESKDESARLQGIALLVKSGNPKAIPFLQRVALNDESPRLRYLAKKGIERIKQLARGEVARPAQPSKDEASKPDEHGYEEDALDTGADNDSGQSEPDDATAMEDSEEAPVHIPGPEAASLDLELLRFYLEKAEDVQEVIYAARVVKEFDLPDFLPLLRSLLSHQRVSDPLVLATIVSTIGFFGEAQDFELMKTLLSHGDSRVRANTVEALESIGNPAAVPLIVPLLGDRDNRIRANAVTAIRHFGDENVFRVLEDMAESGEEHLGDSAAYALSFFDSDRSVKLLDHLTASPISTVSRQAAKSLEKLSESGNRAASDVLARISAANTEPEGDVFDRLMALRDVEISEDDSLTDDSDDAFTRLANLREEI